LQGIESAEQGHSLRDQGRPRSPAILKRFAVVEHSGASGRSSTLARPRCPAHRQRELRRRYHNSPSALGGGVCEMLFQPATIRVISDRIEDSRTRNGARFSGPRRPPRQETAIPEAEMGPI